MIGSDNFKFEIKLIPAKLAKEYIHQYHYSKGSHNGPFPNYGLYHNDRLIGVLMFATPCSENVRSSVFGKDYKDSVIELHRLHIQDGTPKNTESWFISRCLRQLLKDRPQTMAVISFADPTEGHSGTIYKATNFGYYGLSSPAKFYKDQSGRLRHPRQAGKNITLKQAKEWGWELCPRMGKHRYIFLLTKQARKLCLLEKKGFPNGNVH